MIEFSHQTCEGPACGQDANTGSTRAGKQPSLSGSPVLLKLNHQLDKG